MWKKILLGILKEAWRVSGPIIFGAGTVFLTTNPYGIAAGVALKGVSGAMKHYWKSNNKKIPGWFSKLPF